MAKFLDQAGVGKLWTLIKSRLTRDLAGKVDKVSGKGLSTEDYTTAEKTKLAGLPSIIPQEVFITEYGTTTLAQIQDAITAGKIPVCYYNSRLYIYTHNNTNGYFFGCYTNSVSNNYQTYFIYINLSGSWSSGQKTPEHQGHKVTSWQGTPDNDHYPSEKLVYDSISEALTTSEIDTIWDNAS